MSYTPINWDEYTPITATNLDIMDMGINDNESRISNNEDDISSNKDDISSNEGRISNNEDDIDVIETVSGTVTVSDGSSEEITHNLGSENVVVTVALLEDEDYFATSVSTAVSDRFGYSITDPNNIRIHNGFSRSHTFRYTVTRTG